jgi:hypothetical protein
VNVKYKTKNINTSTFFAFFRRLLKVKLFGVLDRKKKRKKAKRMDKMTIRLILIKMMLRFKGKTRNHYEEKRICHEGENC